MTYDLADRNKGATFWLGGDFNLPDIDWADLEIVGNQNLKNMFVCLFAVRGGQFLRDPVNSNVSKRTDRMDFTYSLDLHFHASHIDANHIGASTYENHIRAFRRPEG